MTGQGSRGRWLGSALLLVLAGCSGMVPARGRTDEFRSTTAPKANYTAVAVIGGDNSGPTLQMSANVRAQLTESGINAVRVAGRWDDERDALQDICLPTAEEPVQGVLIVTYSTLILHECTSKQIAYRIVGGGRLGISQMADRVLQYIRSVASQS